MAASKQEAELSMPDVEVLMEGSPLADGSKGMARNKNSQGLLSH